MKTNLDSYAAQKYMTREFLRFMETSGVLGLLPSFSDQCQPEIFKILSNELGYRTDKSSCLRMINTMLDMLCECDMLVKDKDKYRLGIVRGELLSCDVSDETVSSDARIGFFNNCLSYAETYLTTGAPLYTFDNCSADVWDDFLGNEEFRFARSVMVNLLFKDMPVDADVLDLCSGPGFGVIQMQEKLPTIKIKALDFKDTFRSHVKEKALNPDAVEWVPHNTWGGFGYPLPFNDGSLDRVFFACADPYIPPEVKRYVYMDIRRVLKPGGAIGILSRSYPDPEAVYVKESWIRKEVLCHDFCENVCEGWQGFSDVRDMTTLFNEVGFEVEDVMLNSSIWRLNKP